MIDAEEEKTTLEVIVDKTNSLGNRSVKKFKINQVPKQGSKFTGILKSVIFLPSDLDLLLSSPSIRRKYLDSIFYQISGEYKTSILNYTKALKQRNKILELMFEEKNLNISHFESQLEFWTSKIISEGKIIQSYRQDFFDFLSENLFSLNEKLGLIDFQVEFNYLPNPATEENFLNSKEKEFFTRTTQFGPHKDDFEILLNEKNIQYFASRGQQRVSLIIVKIIELDYISEKTKERPILLLDDIFSELDDKHKNSILKIIKEQQTFISSVYKLPEFEDLSDQIIDIEEIR
jgi:DNA replication and repair protein RecF